MALIYNIVKEKYLRRCFVCHKSYYEQGDKTMKYYVGVKSTTREVFKFHRDPLESDNLPFNAVIGPFKTKRGANFMALYGQGNPHCQTVSDAERLAKEHNLPSGRMQLARTYT